MNRSFFLVVFFCFLALNSLRAQKAVVPLTWAEHPRLFFSKGGEAAVWQQAKTRPLLAALIDMLKATADETLGAEPQPFKPGEELLDVSREEIGRLLNLSLAYRLFHDDRYAKKAEAELLYVCAYPSWNPEHYLDVAEMATAVAIGYDWCYQYLSPAARTTIEKAIAQKAFATAWPLYETKDKQTPFNRENNWNMVCNSGLVNAALAVGDKYPEEAARIVGYAAEYTPHLLESFAPEGVYNEGPGYWAYNGMYMALLFDNLQRNVHKDFGLPAMKGISRTPRFYECLVGPSGQMFNFGDASTRVDNSGTIFFFSKYYHLPAAALFYRRLLRFSMEEHRRNPGFEISRFFFLSIPWFDDAELPEKEVAPQLEVFSGMTDFLVMNGSSKTDTARLYLAAKTGRPQWSHNQLDVGSFVLDCQGQRWAIDLGADSYHQPNFWSYEPGGQRWKYFRNTNLAHNTLSIDDSITISSGQGELVRFNDRTARPFGIFDLTAAYAGQASSVQRGFKLLQPNAILVRDELFLKKGAGEVTWRFFTNAAVAIDGGTATLTQGGKKFYIRCLLSANFTMQVVEAKPYAATEKPIKNTRIVSITVKAAGDTVIIPVVLTSEPGAGSTDADTALQTWK